jgi:hypothetical protein
MNLFCCSFVCEFNFDLLQIYSDNLLPELPNTVHSCSRHGVADAWLTSARPGNVVPVPGTSTLLGVGVCCLLQRNHLCQG